MYSWLQKKPVPPDAASVMKRAIILKHLFVKGLATPPSRYIAQRLEEWNEDEKANFISGVTRRSNQQIQQLHDGKLWHAMGESEQDFMQKGPTEVTEQSLIDANWLAESAVCLLWALGYVSELPPYDQRANPELTNELPVRPVSILVKEAVLRSVGMIRKHRELAELWHWRSRTRQLQESGRMPEALVGGMTIDKVIKVSSVKAAEDGAFPSPINDDFPALGKAYRDLTKEEFSLVTSIAMERHRAFNWLCGYASGNRWENTPTET